MINIRPFDTIKVINPNGILNQKGGTDHSGNWVVISNHEDFLVVSRGARILRVKHSATEIVETFDIKAETKIGIKKDGKKENGT